MQSATAFLSLLLSLLVFVKIFCTPLTILPTFDSKRAGFERCQQCRLCFVVGMVLVALVSLSTSAAAVAATPTPKALSLKQQQQEDAQNLAKIAQERGRIAQDEAAQRKACYQRFVVSACLLEAEETKRERLKPLREQELQIQERQRQLRAERRRQTIADKVKQMQIREQADRAKLAQLESKQAARLQQAEAKKQQLLQEQENPGIRARLEQQRQQRVAERLAQLQTRQKEGGQTALPLDASPEQATQTDQGQ